MTTSSQRLLDLYQLSASSHEDLQKPTWIDSANGGGSQKRNGMENRKRNTADSPISPMNPPAAPEVPRGPPISFRSAQGSAAPQRSFSQRAKGRPFASEALADEPELVEYGDDGYRQSKIDSRESYEDAPAPTVRHDRTGPLHLDTDVRRGKSIKQTPGAYTAPLESSRPLSQKVQSQSRDVRRSSDTVPRLSQESRVPPRSNTLQASANMTEEQQREWAPDRSPLQKLEVTLNDISKEEKRARVEEAEMLLRESKAGRGRRRVSRDVASPTLEGAAKEPRTSKTTEAPSLADAGLVRNLSSKQRDRLQHSATVDSHKPDVRRLSGEGRGGFEYEEQQFKNDRGKSEGQQAPAYPKQIQSRRRAEAVRTQLPEELEELQHPPLVERQLPGDIASHLARSSREQRSQTQNNNVTRDRNMLEQGNRPLQYSSSNRQGTQSAKAQTGPSFSIRNQQDRDDTRRTTSARQMRPDQGIAGALPTKTNRSVSLQQEKPLPPFPDEEGAPRSGPLKEANSSHKAALAGAAAAGAAAVSTAAPLAMSSAEPTNVGRNGTRRLQKVPPAAQQDNWKELAELAQQRKATAPRPRPENLSQYQGGALSASSLEDPKVATFQRGTPKQVDVQRNPSQRASEPVGLGLHDSTDSRNVPDLREGQVAAPPSQKPQTSDKFRHKPRQHSVSFKEPFDRARPVDEWKEGGVAKLALADQDLRTAPAPDVEKDKAWWESQGGSEDRRKSRRSSGTRAVPANHAAPIDDRHAEFRPPLYLKCGPLLRYTGMKRVRSDQDGSTQSGTHQSLSFADSETWRGSVLIVTEDSRSSYDSVPTLRLFSQPKGLLPPPPEKVEELAPEYVDPIAGLTKMSRTGKALYVRPVDHLDEGRDLSLIEDDNGLYEASPSPLDTNGTSQANTATSNRRTRGADGEALGKFQEVKGVRLYADPIRDVTFWRFNIEIELGEHQAHIAYRINRGPAVGFWVPARGQSMNIMFHSCNGFSMSVNPDVFSGPDPLWRDVLNTHQTRPFHVMIGGGDQIYNDRVMVQTQHFGAWTQLRNPHDKHKAPFSTEMKDELESFYLDRYAMWFSQGLFAMANSQIPMVNMWDDHDIIDGFGSYPDHFMRSPVFSGLGSIAFKYYMLFQHHSVPEETNADEPSWILGAAPGPYINQLSHSVFMHMGKHVAFLGLDCRMERRRDEVLTNKTYDIVLERCRNEIIEGETKHLIVLLGVPIAYPRLVWLENVLTSRAMDPIKALGRVGILKSGFLNRFDGGVEILDDLDDHWTAKNHKHERNDFILDLQDLSAEKSVRITILGGDVHLAAIGQFYSDPKLRVPKDKDHRYMPNVISSAIVNTPPPDMLADILNKRDKVHHLNHYTVEDMIPMFTHDVDGRRRNNKRLLPRRNWCSIREYHPGSTPPPTPPETPSVVSDSEGEEYSPEPEKPQRRFSFSREDVNPRKLFRRISSRGAPPSSYRDDMEVGQNQRPVSMDGFKPARSYDEPGSPQGVPTNRRASFDQPVSINAHEPPMRPGNFIRRPTNLSEKAARKGVVPGIDKEGNEVDVNEHINLEGGLDIVLNCEVNQKDPAGITTPYRLLVPALWYDGSSDREKLDGPLAAAAAVVRRPTLLKRIGLGGNKSGNKPLVNGQGSGNEPHDMSESESYSGSEDGYGGEKEQLPKRRFSLFGRSLSRRRNEDHYEEQEGHIGQGNNLNKDEQMRQEDYASARQQAARQAAMPPQSSPGSSPRQPAVARGSVEEKLYAGGLTIPGASQAFWSRNLQNAPRTIQQARALRGETTGDDYNQIFDQHKPQSGERGSDGQYYTEHPPQSRDQNQNRQEPPRSTLSQRGPLQNSKLARVLGDDTQSQQLQEEEQRQRQQQQHLKKQAAFIQTGPPPNSKLARVLGEQQYSGPTAWGRTKPPGYYSDNQVKPFRSQSQRASSGSNYYPPNSTSNTTTYSQGDSHGGQEDYDGIEAYKEPKKRRWSLTGGKKWIGDGRID